ncbi:MAG: DNA/RNA non-specific endonuclease [Acetobacteraceae bacterium]|nr:DNA/RNA non-specific endonuclease [Acetobacteraceae bacterium]
MNLALRGFLAATLLLSTAAHAEDRVLCPALFAGGQPPALLNPKLAQRTHGLCFDTFAVLDSGVTRGPLWSAEHPTASSLKAAREQPRVNLFHPEDMIPAEDRAELEDYARSGFDRGHMTPSGDMPTPEAQEQSFSLANVVPQAPELNRGVWERIESAVRRLARREDGIYVVTGPVFEGSDLQALHDRVLVPTSTYKAIYDPAQGAAGAYVCTNTNEPECRVVSVAQLASLTGIDPFPAVPAGIKETAMRLPQPRPPRRHRDANGA